MTRRIVTMLAMSALLVAMAAGSAFAQEGFDAEQCSVQIADFYATGDANAVALYEARFAGLEGEALVVEVEAWLAENELTLDEVCTIYGVITPLPEPPEVGGEGEELPDPDAEPDPDPDAEPDPDPDVDPDTEDRPDPVPQPDDAPVDPEAADVRGVSLARTGIDAIVIALIGMTLLALGVVALRRTRPQTDHG